MGWERAPKGRHMLSLGCEPQDEGKKKEKAVERRQMPNRYDCGSRSSSDLPPLRGFFIYWASPPGAHAPGYASFAAPRLTSPGLATPGVRSSHLRHSFDPSHRIPDEPSVLTNCGGCGEDQSVGGATEGTINAGLGSRGTTICLRNGLVPSHRTTSACSPAGTLRRTRGTGPSASPSR